jgi:hypothetical protein
MLRLCKDDAFVRASAIAVSACIFRHFMTVTFVSEWHVGSVSKFAVEALRLPVQHWLAAPTTPVWRAT